VDRTVARAGGLVAGHGQRAVEPVPDPVIRTQSSAFDSLSFADRFSLTLAATGGSGQYSWSIAAGAFPAGLTMTSAGIVFGVPTASGPFACTVMVTDENGRYATKEFTNRVYPVPKPKPIDIAYTLTTIYMPKPSWPSHQWGDMRMVNERDGIKATFGQRMPLLGYYRGDDPEVLDWQIKMAVDRGITCFMFDDYWTEGVDHPIYATSSGAFLRARYRDRMTFGMPLNPPARRTASRRRGRPSSSPRSSRTTSSTTSRCRTTSASTGGRSCSS
jgi:hypothetical protein